MNSLISTIELINALIEITGHLDSISNNSSSIDIATIIIVLALGAINININININVNKKDDISKGD